MTLASIDLKEFLHLTPEQKMETLHLYQAFGLLSNNDALLRLYEKYSVELGHYSKGRAYLIEAAEGTHGLDLCKKAFPYILQIGIIDYYESSFPTNLSEFVARHGLLETDWMQITQQCTNETYICFHDLAHATLALLAFRGTLIDNSIILGEPHKSCKINEEGGDHGAD